MHGRQIKFSLVIPSHDRRALLRACLHSIEEAHARARDIAIEIVIVFCGLNMEKSEFDLKYPELTITRYCEKNNVCRAKNIGINQARGEFIVLLDDDATVGGDFLLKLDELAPHAGKVFSAKIQDPATGECFAERDKTLAGRKLRRVDYDLFKGSALVVKKALLLQAGLFNEDFGPGGRYYSAEESDLFFRIKLLKEEVRYAPELVVYHPVPELFPKSKAYRYAFAAGAVLVKYCLDDWPHLYAYLFLIARRYAICAVRIIQTVLFSGCMRARNEKRRYAFVAKGQTMGIRCYLKHRFPRDTRTVP